MKKYWTELIIGCMFLVCINCDNTKPSEIDNAQQIESEISRIRDLILKLRKLPDPSTDTCLCIRSLELWDSIIACANEPASPKQEAEMKRLIREQNEENNRIRKIYTAYADAEKTAREYVLRKHRSK